MNIKKRIPVLNDQKYLNDLQKETVLHKNRAVSFLYMIV